MRSRTVLAALTVVGVLGGAGRAVADPPAAWEGFANAWIASHAQRVKGQQAPRETRKHCEGDVNGDGHDDIIVIYSIEGVGGGNDWTQYATVLTSAPQGYGATFPKEVGSKSVRAVEGCTVSGANVELDFKTFGPKDASCCPSVPGKASLKFQKGALVDPASPAPVPSGK